MLSNYINFSYYLFSMNEYSAGITFHLECSDWPSFTCVLHLRIANFNLIAAFIRGHSPWRFA